MNAAGSALLDTWVVVGYLRKQDQSLLGQMERMRELYLPLTALGELLYGAYRSKDKEHNLEDVRKFLKVCSLLIPDEVTAYCWRSNTNCLSPRATLTLLKCRISPC